MMSLTALFLNFQKTIMSIGILKQSSFNPLCKIICFFNSDLEPRVPGLSARWRCKPFPATSTWWRPAATKRSAAPHKTQTGFAL